jgi:methionyl-tRNA formyltransferase
MEKKKIKIVFMGTSNFAEPILRRLQEDFSVALVVSSPDKPGGRNLSSLIRPPIKILAEELGLPIEQPASLKNNLLFFDRLKKIKPDLIVVAAYGKILPPEIINLPEHGCLNIHPSLLPKYRGASPIQSALLAGDVETGVSIILMDLGMDTGDILAQEKMDIEPSDDFETLGEKLAVRSAKMLAEIIVPFVRSEITQLIQADDLATYCSKIEDNQGAIQWILSARAIHNRIRALRHRAGTFTEFAGKRLNIVRADYCSDPTCVEIEDNSIAVGTVFKCAARKAYCVKCGSDALILKEVQLEGKKIMAIEDFVNGQRDFVGSILK